MSSRIASAWLAVLVSAWPLGCAGFARGEYWRDSEGDSGGVADDADAGDDEADGGPGDGGPGDGGSEGSGAGESGGDGGSGESGESSGGSAGPSFASDVLPLLRAGCERCHAADGEASDTDFILGPDDDDAYESTLEQVDVDAPGSSRLLAKTAGKGHTGGVIYSDHSSQYETMLDWIEHGAPP